jgi:protein TonB
MSSHLHSFLLRCVIAILMLIPGRFAAAQGSLTAARDLYSAAAYDDALTMLNRLIAVDTSPDDNRTIGLYRMLCLMALGRSTDAVHAAEALVTRYPSYRPPATEVPPRALTLFSDARKRLLPGIVQEQYRQAKAAWDRQDFAAAADGFAAVLKGLDDPDLVPAAGQPPLLDLRILAAGFHELSAKASVPPPTAPAPVAEVAAPPAAPAAPLAPPARRADRIFSVEDTNVVSPVVLEQSPPVFPGPVLIPARGAVEIIIDASGAVESAAMTIPMNKMYDQIVLTATKKWRYRPATLEGVPVKFRKIVTVTFSPSR